jgi:DNA repair exonuclease SbcCD ATPase subunit
MEMTREQVASTREAFDKAFGGGVRRECIALCDSHEAFRARIEELEAELAVSIERDKLWQQAEAKVAELERERQKAIAIIGAQERVGVAGEEQIQALTSQLAAAREALKDALGQVEASAAHCAGEAGSTCCYFGGTPRGAVCLTGKVIQNTRAALAAGKDAKP